LIYHHVTYEPNTDVCIVSFLPETFPSLHISSAFALVFQNADVLLPMVRWLGDIDADDQQWLAGAVYQLCTVNLPRYVPSQ